MIQTLILSTFILFSTLKAEESSISFNSATKTKSSFKITSIELEHTNPSLGPYETITIVTLQSNLKTATKIQEFIHRSTINQTCSLFEYIEATLTDNKILIQKVYASQPKNNLNEGEQISNLIFHFEGGEIFEVSDVYRRFTLTNFYGEFTKYMIDNGSITKIDNTIERPKPMKD